MCIDYLTNYGKITLKMWLRSWVYKGYGLQAKDALETFILTLQWYTWRMYTTTDYFCRISFETKQVIEIVKIR